MMSRPLAAVVLTAVLLTGCSYSPNNGLRVPNDPDADAFVNQMLKTAFATWDARTLCDAADPGLRNGCRKKAPAAFARYKAADGNLVRVNGIRSTTYYVFMRALKHAFYHVDLTYAKARVRMVIYVWNQDKVWQIVYYRFETTEEAQ